MTIDRENTDVMVVVDTPEGFQQVGESSGQYLMRISENENGRKTIFIVLEPDE